MWSPRRTRSLVTTIIHVPEGMDATETELKTLCCFSARLPYLADLTAAQPERSGVRAELSPRSVSPESIRKTGA